ncbi:hypothetical protein M1O55_00505 [Dehalococcoidia bacterium]|jgi:hypothetical protein|nr:hypothetical protein [Dehalococcoidia bacterium]MDP7628380.1 hypothetical protein [SAR202 cluster bacterium]
MAENLSRRIPRDFDLHWGKGKIIEEASIAGQYHNPSIQMLEFQDGSLSLRFCYYNHQGRFQRGPLVIGQEDIGRLREAVSENPRLRALLRGLVA